MHDNVKLYFFMYIYTLRGPWLANDQLYNLCFEVFEYKKNTTIMSVEHFQNLFLRQLNTYYKPYILLGLIVFCNKQLYK